MKFRKPVIPVLIKCFRNHPNSGQPMEPSYLMQKLKLLQNLYYFFCNRASHGLLWSKDLFKVLNMKYVLIGTGNISRTYIKAMDELPGSEIVACISRNGNRPQQAEDLPSWSALNEVVIPYDAVIICTPNGLHSSHIIEAATLGKPAITEKPLGIEKSSMKEAITICSERDLVLSVAYQRRTAPDNQTIKKLIEERKLGNFFAVDLSAKFYRSQDYYDSAPYRGGYEIDGGGPFIQQACHNIDLYQWFFGMPNRVVSMMDTFTHNIEAEDHGAALLRHSNGMIGTIVASTSTKPGFSARLEAHSNLGSFTMIDDVITEWHFDHIPNPAETSFNYTHDGATSASVSDTSAHKKIILDFEHCVKTGNQPIADGPSAMLTSELILEIYNQKI